MKNNLLEIAIAAILAFILGGMYISNAISDTNYETCVQQKVVVFNGTAFNCTKITPSE